MPRFRRGAIAVPCAAALLGCVGTALASSGASPANPGAKATLSRKGRSVELGHGTIAGSKWKVLAYSTQPSRNGAVSNLGCIAASAGAGSSSKKACGPLGTSETTHQPPLYALAGGASPSAQSVLGMSLPGNVVKVTLELGSGAPLTRRTSYLRKAPAAAAHLRRFRYIALAFDHAVCIDQVTGLDRSGHRAFVLDANECRSSSAPPPNRGVAPKVALEAPESVPRGAVLRGAILPGGLDTHYRFEWGPTEAYGNSLPVPDGGAGQSQASQPVRATISGLDGTTAYYYRLVAENGAGRGEAKESFTTPNWRPTMIFEAATEITKRSAILHAGIVPNGFGTKYRYEWGPTKSYGYAFEPPTELTGPSELQVSQKIENLQGETTYFYRVVAENSEGSGESRGTFATLPSESTRRHGHWGLLSLPNREGTLSDANRLTGVSCFVLTQCMAVGEFEEVSAPVQSLSERRNGSTWEIPSMLEKPLGVSIAGVSCVSPAHCVAVGHYVTASGNVTLAELWDGSEWQIQQTPNPALGGVLTAVSCVTTEECTAVGDYRPTAGEVKSLALHWNGTEWSVQSTPNLPGANPSKLTGVSCNSFVLAGLFEKECVASGYGETLQGVNQALSARWDGTEWKFEQIPLPEEEAKESVLSAISCAPSTECQAVGYLKEKSGAVVPLSDFWNGIFDPTWQAQAPQSPAGAKEAKLTAVSCNDTVAIECMAVGEYEDSSGGLDSFGDQWFNQEAWGVLSTPAQEHARASYLNAISCVGGGECVATGYYVNGGGVEVTLGEQFG